jgi:hypothetical protein
MAVARQPHIVLGFVPCMLNSPMQVHFFDNLRVSPEMVVGLENHCRIFSPEGIEA